LRVEVEDMEPVTERKPRRAVAPDGCARRDEILDAATTLFAEHGYSDMVTQALVEKLQVGKRTLYRHFPSKRDLFLATADRVMRRLRERIDADVAGIEDPLDRPTEAVRSFLGFFADHPEFVELLIQKRAHFKDRKKPTYFEHREKNELRWGELFRSLIAEGRVRAVPVERITDVLSNLVYGAMFTNYFTGPSKPAEVQSRDILDLFLHGILVRGESPRRPEVGGSEP
jgi:AcrR family transcriptional regulator